MKIACRTTHVTASCTLTGSKGIVLLALVNSAGILDLFSRQTLTTNLSRDGEAGNDRRASI
ncbi:hypothetical protein ABE504_25130 [Paenibacillus oryzisoli]|uniref:hypothetical protein n=1 Tax=Paenibacillus oryzisoli TaxID=1850517 RepID=UPI003D273650